MKEVAFEGESNSNAVNEIPGPQFRIKISMVTKQSSTGKKTMCVGFIPDLIILFL